MFTATRQVAFCPWSSGSRVLPPLCSTSVQGVPVLPAADLSLRPPGLKEGWAGECSFCHFLSSWA